MSKPWEVVMQFQEKLKQAATAIPKCKQLSSTAQQFQPFRGNDVISRAKKVQDIVNESCRVIEQSKPPPLNTTVVNFCQNCTCAQCSHQSSNLESDGDLDATITSVVQSYEAFLEMQKQQFMVMIGQLSQVADSIPGLSMSGIAMQQSCAVLRTNSAFKKVGAVECDSSVKSVKSMEEAVTSENLSTEPSLPDQVCQSPTSTVNEECEDDCSSTCTLPAKDENQPKSIDTKVNFNQVMNEKSDECMDIHSCQSFDNFHDENYQPVRKSLTKKYKDCSVILHPLNVSYEKPVRSNGLDKQILSPLTCQKQCSASKFRKHQNQGYSYDDTLSSSVELHSNSNCNSRIRNNREKEKLLSDLSIVFDDKAPKPVIDEANNIELVKPNTTRSGRTVQNPGQFWIKSTSQGLTNIYSGIQQLQPTAAEKRRIPLARSLGKGAVRTQTTKVPVASKERDTLIQKGQKQEANSLHLDQPVLGSESKIGIQQPQSTAAKRRGRPPGQSSNKNEKHAQTEKAPFLPRKGAATWRGKKEVNSLQQLDQPVRGTDSEARIQPPQSTAVKRKGIPPGRSFNKSEVQAQTKFIPLRKDATSLRGKDEANSLQLDQPLLGLESKTRRRMKRKSVASESENGTKPVRGNQLKYKKKKYGCL